MSPLSGQDSHPRSSSSKSGPGARCLGPLFFRCGAAGTSKTPAALGRRMKRLIAAFVGYLAVTSVLAGGLLGGVIWLTRPDAAESAPAQVAPIPPRIADSIERKKTTVPPPAALMPVKVMQEANASLSQPTAKWVIRELTTPRARKREMRPRSAAPARGPADANAAAPFNAAPMTGRSDNFSGL
jgi:hypothetical protein